MSLIESNKYLTHDIRFIWCGKTLRTVEVLRRKEWNALDLQFDMIPCTYRVK